MLTFLQTAWNWSLKTGFFWAGFCFLCIVYTYFRIPEPAGRTFAELDLLFERGVSARKFAKTKVDVFEENVEGSGVVEQYERKVSNAAIHKEGATEQYQPELKGV